MVEAGVREMIEEVVSPLRAELAELRRRLEIAEDAADVIAFDAADRSEEALPLALVKRLVNGESPVLVYRQHRNLSVEDLATTAGLSIDEVMAFERGRSPEGNARSKLAAALDVDEDDLDPMMTSEA